MKPEQCPCKQCPVLVICRDKKYLRLFSQCSLLQAYEPYYFSAENRDEARIEDVEKILNPTRWHLRKPQGKKHKLIMYRGVGGEKLSYIYGGPCE